MERITTIPQGIHLIPVPTPLAIGTVHLYLLQGERLTLVDTGVNTPDALQALEHGLQEVGFCIADIDQIVLTHHHCDHSGLLGTLLARSQAKLYCHDLTPHLMNRDLASHFKWHALYEEIYRGLDLPLHVLDKQKQLLDDDRMLMDVWQGQVDATLKEGDSVPGATEWQVIHTPGHSQDHISLWRQKDGVLLLGDHLLKHIASAVLVEPSLKAGTPRPNMMRLQRDSLQKIRAREWQIGLPSHGKLITNPHELIDKRLAAQAKRASTILELVRQGKQTGYEIAKALLPANVTALPMIVPDLLGHLDCLVEEGTLLVETTASGLWQYRVKES